jgi:mannosyltransferase
MPMIDAASRLQGPAPLARLGWRISPVQLTLALMGLALGVRAIGLGMRPLWLDEAFSSWFSERSWTYLWSVVPTFEAHPPFYYSLLKLWSGLFGDDAIALRSLSVLFAILTIPLVTAIAFEWERQRPTGRPLLHAGVAGLLVACSPLLIVIGQEARPYPLLTLAYAAAILGALRLMRQFAAGGAGDRPTWILFAVGTELALWSHALGILYALCLALTLAPAWFRRPPTVRIRRGLAAGVAVALVYLPCLLMVLNRAGDWSANWLRWKPEMLLQLVGLYSVPTGQLTVGALVATMAMLLLIKRAFQHGAEARGWTTERAMLLLWLGPPLLSALLSALFVPVFLPRTLAATLVPAYLAMSAALARTQTPRERTILAAVLFATLVPVAVQTALRPATERWDAVAAFLAANVAPGDQVWLYPSDSALPLAHVGSVGARPIPAAFPTLGIKGPMRAGWPAMVSVTPQQAATLVADPKLARVPTIWLVTRQSGIFDPGGDMPAALARVRQPGQASEWGYIAVRPYRLANRGR